MHGVCLFYKSCSIEPTGENVDEVFEFIIIDMAAPEIGIDIWMCIANYFLLLLMNFFSFSVAKQVGDRFVLNSFYKKGLPSFDRFIKVNDDFSVLPKCSTALIETNIPCLRF